MKDAPFDLRDYVLDELAPAERAEVERYLSTSVEAREEVERLRLTHRALLTMPEEEPPRRIAFVSDKVFEPSRARRIWQALWQGAPKFGFSMAAVMLVFFAGAWATQPTVVSDQNGWRLAFGQPPVQQPLAVETARELSPQQVQQVAEILRESESRHEAAIAEAIQASEAKSQGAIRSEVQQIRAAWEEYSQFDKARWDRLLVDLNPSRTVAYDGRQ